MDKISTKQLLDTAIEIVGLANKCHRARLIDDWQASFSITDDTNYEFEVRVNPYRSSEKKWTAKARNYEHFETENNFTQDNMEEMKELKEHLEGLIEDARKDLQAKLDTLNG